MVTKDNSSLILSGQSERIIQAVIESKIKEKEIAQKLEVVNRENKIQACKLAYADNFVTLVAERFKIKKESALQLLKNLADGDLLKIDEVIAKNLKSKASRRSFLRAFLKISWLGIWLSAVILSIIFESGSGLWIMLAIISSMGFVPTILLLMSFICSCDSDADSFNSYLILRRKLKNQYGPKYFPYQELNEVRHWD